MLARGGVVFIDDSRRGLFTDDGWFAQRRFPSGSDQYRDLYVLVSNPSPAEGDATSPQDYRGALRAYSQAAGGTPMLPRRFLGNWWSRYYKYTEKSLGDLILKFEELEVPLSVTIIDMDWHIVDSAKDISGPDCHGWTGYTWNKEFFPDPARFIQWLHARGMSTALNLHPASGVWRHESMYKEYAEFLGAVDMAKRGSPIPFDLSTDLSAAAYFKVLLHPHEEMGDYEKSFWWIDWQQGAQSRLEGIDPLFQLNHLHFLDLARGGRKRPGVFSRFAGLGSHRYPIGFSGDTWATWESLAFQPFMTASASNANYFYWSHDIGGHTREIPNNGELYARWVQFGCWSPILRLHSSNNPYIFRNPWTYSEEVCTAAKNAMRRRHELVPYIFSCVYRAHVESVPLVMPMYYTHSEEEAAYAVSAQYWFGSELIVAPFVTPKDETTNLARQVVWLPGTDADSKSPIKAPWRDLHTGEAFTAGCFHSVYAGSLDYVPVFAKPGGIIPCAPPSAGSGQELNSVDSPETVCLTVVAGDDGKFELYEDEETGDQRKFITDIQLDWESSTNCTLRISGIANVNDRGSKIRVENDSDLQGVVPPSRTWKVTMLGVSGGSQVAIANQEEAAVAEYDAERESLSFTVSDVSVLQNISVSVCAGSETELLSTRDRRLEKMTQYLKTFAVGREVVWNLSGRLNEILENVSALRSVNEATSNVIIQDRFGTYWTVSPAMKRVLFETVSGDGCDRSFLSRQGAPAIAWKRPNSSVSIVTVEGKQVELGSSGYKVFWPSDEDTASTVEVTHADIVTVSLPLRDLVDNLPWPAPAVTNTAEKK